MMVAVLDEEPLTQNWSWSSDGVLGSAAAREKPVRENGSITKVPRYILAVVALSVVAFL